VSDRSRPGARSDRHGCLSLAFSPEREDPGNTSGLAHDSKSVGRVNRQAGAPALALYRRSWRGWCLSARASAICPSCRDYFSLCNIALVNELKSWGLAWASIVGSPSTAAGPAFGFHAVLSRTRTGRARIPSIRIIFRWKAREYDFGDTVHLNLAGKVEHGDGPITSSMRGVGPQRPQNR